MKYDRKWAIDQYSRGSLPAALPFWGYRSAPGQIHRTCLNQWYDCRFEVDGVEYRSAGQYMMAQKAEMFHDPETCIEIMETDDPRTCRALGRAVRPFDDALWDRAKYDIVLRGNVAKFSQNPALRAYLEGTGDRVLVNASPYDGVWGVKLSRDDPRIGDPRLWGGENLLGFALMEVRDALRARAGRQLRSARHPYLDGLLGLAVGDALGVPFEHLDIEQMRLRPCTGMTDGGIYRLPPGTWSDDTSMALCVADSLGARGVDPFDVMRRFCAWKNQRQYTATGVVFAVGGISRRGIENFQRGVHPSQCGDFSDKSNSNGGLMRNFPIALYASLNTRDIGDMLRLVHSYSALTHGHPIGLICCGLYALFIDEWMKRGAGRSVFEAMDCAIGRGRAWYAMQGGGFAEAIRRPGLFLSASELRAKTEDALPAFGRAVYTWNIAVWSLLNTNNYRDCVLRAINLGHDTDTNGAVAGSLAGLVYGLEAIPAEWVGALRNRGLIERIAERLDGIG